MMRRLTPLVLILLATATCIGCDQITKDFARDHLLYGARMTLVNDLVHLVYAENAGVAFGIGAALPSTVRFWLFIVGIVGVLILIGVVAYRRRGMGAVFLSGITLVMAGGLSNLIDRLMNDGHVVDFLVLDVGGLRTIVFNLADVLVLLGTTLLIIGALRAERGRGAVQSASSEW
jgi:signal peptidase II